MSEFIQPMAPTDTLVEATFREIAFQVMRTMARHNVLLDSRDENVLGETIKQILTKYDEGRIRENQMWRKMATDAVMQAPGRPFVISGPPISWHGADPTLVKCKTCGFTHPTGTITDHAYWPVEG